MRHLYQTVQALMTQPFRKHSTMCEHRPPGPTRHLLQRDDLRRAEQFCTIAVRHLVAPLLQQRKAAGATRIAECRASIPCLDGRKLCHRNAARTDRGARPAMAIIAATLTEPESDPALTGKKSEKAQKVKKRKSELKLKVKS